jgi:hypothetical protein
MAYVQCNHRINPPEADNCCGRGYSKPKMVTTIETDTTQTLVRVLLDLSHNNRHLVFFLPKTNHDVSLLEKAGSTVVEYFEWDLPKVLSQGIAELLKYTDNSRFSSEPDVVESNRDADS